LSKLVRVTDMLNNVNLAVNLKKKYGAAAIFVLYGNKNIPSAEILRGSVVLVTELLFYLA
jgi:hypothetical protein